MKPSIILNMMGQRGVLAVAEAVLEQVDVEFITMEPVFSYLAHAGIPQNLYGQYVPDDDDGSITDDVQRRLELLESGIQRDSFRESFPFLDDSSWKIVLRRLRNVVHREMLNNMITVEATRRCIAENDLRLIVSSEDIMPVTRSMITTARESSIPSLQVIHSVPSGQITTHPASTSTYVAAYSEYSKWKYESIGVPSENILVTGNPAWDRLARSPLPKHRTEICEKIGLKPDNPIVTYAWTHSSTWTIETAARPDLHIQHAEAVLDAFISLSRKYPQWQFLMRPRPDSRTDKVVRDMLKRANKQGLDKIYIDEQPPYDSLVLSDVLVNTESNMGIEAILLGKPAICVNLPELWGDVLNEGFGGLFDEHDAVIRVENACDIASAIESAILDPQTRKHLLEKRKYSIKKFNHDNCGKGAEHVASVIASIVKNGKVTQDYIGDVDAIDAGPSPYAMARQAKRTEADLLNKQGEQCFEDSDIRGAVEKFVSAISVCPNQGLYYSNLGTALNAANKHDEAWEAFIKALHYDPCMPAARANLRKIAITLDRDEEAEKILTLFGRDT